MRTFPDLPFREKVIILELHRSTDILAMRQTSILPQQPASGFKPRPTLLTQAEERPLQ